VGKAIVAPDGTVVRRIKPKKVGHVPVSHKTISYIDHALMGTAKTGTMAWKFIGFPLDKVRVRSKTGSAEVYGKQSTSWVASYNKQYVVVMMVSQAGTGSGTSGPAVRKIWESLYGIHGMHVDKANAALPDATPPAGLPVFAKDGEILPPVPPRRKEGS
jgi:penicillin-binding protein 2